MESAVVLIFLSLSGAIVIPSSFGLQIERLRHSKVASFDLIAVSLCILTINVDLKREEVGWDRIADVALGSICSELVVETKHFGFSKLLLVCFLFPQLLQLEMAF
jgi:hypothetical protein